MKPGWVEVMVFHACDGNWGLAINGRRVTGHKPAAFAGNVVHKWAVRISDIDEALRSARPAVRTCPTCGSADLDDRGNCYACLAEKSTGGAK